jgi:uncharacterized protein (TIGR02145 family)/prepilin-type N-terminal cleavage/methylation domain-containing protein
MQKRFHWFTLVELIVVITILAILGTIAFISIQWYSRDARDSRRISDINNLEQSLELFGLQVWKYPLPDNAQSVSYSWETVYSQWIIWDTVTSNLSRNLSKKPTDPLTVQEYIYSVSNSQQEYELLAVYEWGTSHSPIPNTYASSLWLVKVEWNYNQLYVKTPHFIIPIPSIISVLPPPFTLDSETIKSQIISNGNNFPSQWWSQWQTWGLDITLSVYTGSITSSSSDQEKQDAVQTIQSAYTWSILSNVEPYSYLLNQTSTWSLVAFADITLLNSTSTSSNTETTSWGTTPPLVWWRWLDSNCDIDDVTIWTQIWAWCNSTLWIGVEFWQTDADLASNSDVYSGTVWDCYKNHQWTNNTVDCVKQSVAMASNAKSNTWFTGTNSNGDSAPAAIWWKFYTWENRGSACPEWRHVPSDTEWTTLENYLHQDGICRTWNNWECTGIGWKGYTAYAESETPVNIIQALKIPLSGYREYDGTTFKYRGFAARLWSDTPNGDYDAYRRGMYWDYNTVYRTSFSQLNGFSIRCLKD